jgi:hypothetical protein
VSTDATRPIRSAPGTNVEADAFNILLAAIDGDWRRIRDTVKEQDRYTNERCLACFTVWFAIIMRNLPEELRNTFLNHYREVASNATAEQQTTR